MSPHGALCFGCTVSEVTLDGHTQHEEQGEDFDCLSPDLSWNSVRHRDAFREIRLGARRRLQLSVSHLGHQFDTWTQPFSQLLVLI